jgi:hypothetical protein
MKAPLEKDVQKTCCDWLRLWGCCVVRVNSGAMKIEGRFVKFNSEPGCADTLVCLPGGRFLSLELKRPGRDRTSSARTAEQAAHRERIRKAGGLAIVTNSLDDLIRQLTEAGYDTRRMKT